jgi:hypothetical protein
VFQTIRPFLAALAAALLVSATGSAQRSKTLKLGEKFAGELSGKRTALPKIAPKMRGKFGGKGKGGRRGSNLGFGKKLPVSLKAGQSVSISATVAGAGRNVLLVLLDPTGEVVGHTAFKETTARLDIEEVNATGRYEIVVFSDKSGNFTLRATGPSAEADAEALEKRIKELKEELKELETKLKALKAKSGKKGEGRVADPPGR